MGVLLKNMRQDIIDQIDYGDITKDELLKNEVMVKPYKYVSNVNNKQIEGRLEGRIVLYKETGQSSPDFYSIQKDHSGENYDVFEFCNGLEYELDNFIDYVVSELEEKK